MYRGTKAGVETSLLRGCFLRRATINVRQSGIAKLMRTLLVAATDLRETTPNLLF